MAERTGFSWSAAAIGAVASLLLLALIGAVLVFGGFVPVSASKSDPDRMSKIIHSTMERSVKRSAQGLQAPQLSRADALEGGSHFKGMCQQCHGAPGAERDDFATGLNPRPPDLAERAGEWTREEIFWIAKHGIRMTGMPAFGPTAPDDELWKIAAFVEELPNIAADEYAALPDAHADGGHGNGEQGESSHSH